MDCPEGYLWDNKKLKCDKSNSDICARGFNARSQTFSYSAPRADEKVKE